MEAQPYTRRLRLNKRQYEEILSRMESRCGFMPGKDNRDAERFVFAVADIPIRVEHPDGGTSSFLVFGRNISRSGMSILHGGYLHPGSRCRLVLSQVHGEPLVVSGEVRHCRLFAGSCHEIGIRFTRDVEPSLLVGSAQEESARDAGTPEPQASGTALVAEAFAPDHHLLAHHLGLLGLEVRSAETAGAVIDTVRLLDIDIVLLGLRLVSQHGLRAVQKVREMGFRKPVLVLLNEGDPGLEDQARSAGANEVIQKPFDINFLLAQIRVQLGCDVPNRPLYSTEANRPGMPPLIARYVELVRRTADQVERTFREAEFADLREYCFQLRGSGCGYGFQNVTVAAIATLKALDAGEQSPEAKAAIETLLATCRSMEFTAPLTEAG